MKTVIIPIDFSPISLNAMHYGIDMAMSVNASIMLLHMYHVPVSLTDVPVVLISVDELKEQAETKIAQIREQVEHIVAGKVKVYAEARLGDVEDELKLTCEKIQPFAIVMGTKGASSFEHILFGSNTLHAIRNLTWPVITIPPGKTFGTGIKKIGFACDFRDMAQQTPSDKIHELVSAFNAEFHVLNVDYKEKHFQADTPEQSALVHTLLEDLNPVYDFIGSPDIETGINEFAENNNLDLIIAIPKKHKLLEGLFHKSATKQLVFHSHIPVACIHE